MPAKSEKQRRLMHAAMHGSDHPKARKVRKSMSRAKMRHFASSVEHESTSYDWRQRNNLRQNRG